MGTSRPEGCFNKLTFFWPTILGTSIHKLSLAHTKNKGSVLCLIQGI
ncbi:hypothetical protein J2T13_002985 [Paenibacillus sp. DS2015]